MNTTTQNKKYAVVVVFSNWALRQLCMFLEDELEARPEQIGVMRIDRAQGKETNRTIMLIERSLYDVAVAKGFTQQQRGVDFKVTEFEVRDYNKPKKGFTRNFFVPLPEAVSASDAQAQLENKLDVFCNFGMFEKNRPRLKIPLLSRESEKHRGRAFVTFARETDDDELALARILLHDTRLYTNENDYELMKCLWAKERSPPSSPKASRKGDKKGQTKQGHAKQGPKGKGAPKKALKKAPAKKGLAKTGTVPAKPAVVPTLAPGENKWDKPLDGLTPLPPLNATAPVVEVPEKEKEDVPVEEERVKTEPVVPTGVDFPPLK